MFPDHRHRNSKAFREHVQTGVLVVLQSDIYMMLIIGLAFRGPPLGDLCLQAWAIIGSYLCMYE